MKNNKIFNLIGTSLLMVGLSTSFISCEDDDNNNNGNTVVAPNVNFTALTKNNSIAIKVQGGKLKVNFEENNGNYTKVFLIGPATFVFEGKLAI